MDLGQGDNFARVPILWHLTLETSLVICMSPGVTPVVVTFGMNPPKVEVPRLLLFVHSWGFPHEAEMPSFLSCSRTRLPIKLLEKHFV